MVKQVQIGTAPPEDDLYLIVMNKISTDSDDADRSPIREGFKTFPFKKN